MQTRTRRDGIPVRNAYTLDTTILLSADFTPRTTFNKRSAFALVAAEFEAGQLRPLERGDSVLAKQAGMLVFDYLVTLADVSQQLLPVKNLNVTAYIADHSHLLQT